MFDPFEKLEIDILATFIADKENPDYEGRLIDIMTEEHLKKGIRKYFEDTEGWHEGLMEGALKMYKDAVEAEQVAQRFCDDLMQSIIPHWGMRTHF
jgi:hypothetical protein